MSAQGEAGGIKPSVQNEEPSGPTACNRVCVHEGDRICYNDLGDKGLVKKIQGAENTNSNSTASLELDSLHSGESLFKTFTFDTQDSDPAIEKCMAFWKTILEKNVKPVNCSLLKVKKNRKKVTGEKKVKSIPPCDHEETQKMWTSIYEDLQKRKLDKIKLVKKQKCDPCEEYIDEELEKKQQIEDIRKLNEWKSQTKPSRLGQADLKSQIRRTLDALQINKSTKVQNSISKNQDLPKQLSSVRHTTSSIKTAKESVNVDKREPESETSATPTTESTPKSAFIQENRKHITQQQDEITVCCSCGYQINECICEQFTIDVADQIVKESVEFAGSCHPRDCESVCVCDNLQDKQVFCKCGCGVDGCLCQKYNDEKSTGSWTCGCATDECICQKLDEKETNECSCGCGSEECICEQLFTRSCKCDHADCNCDIIEILSTYMETLQATPNVTMGENDLRFTSKGAQTNDDTEWTIEAIQKKGSYCVICGHFNCFCK
ncbi:uncharacterized protein BDFB_002750, partial [Asbolus verrucosus]